MSLKGITCYDDARENEKTINDKANNVILPDTHTLISWKYRL